jgi:hypothetical protein
MIWGILYFICAAICCGIILYVEDVASTDPIIAVVLICSIIWPLLLLLVILYGLAHCIKLLLTKIIKTK